MNNRQIILDTETTGLEPSQGHRIIEIGAVELINRRFTGNNLHYYINPEREVDSEALAVHGLNSAFLADKPKFSEIFSELLKYITDAELIIHNAPFDLAFLEHELRLAEALTKKISKICRVTDTLTMARKLHPGQKNSLDALCKRYKIDNTHRTLHGALLDAQILGYIYLAMTGGQSSLLKQEEHYEAQTTSENQTLDPKHVPQKHFDHMVTMADAEELRAHKAFLELIQKKSHGKCRWEME